MENLYEAAQEAKDFLKNKTSLSPKVGIILGTGLGGMIEEIEVEQSISYADIPHFPISTVESHQGKLIFGKIEGVPVLAMQGRFHFYEGYSMQQVTFPVRVMKLLGIEHLFVSNAAGGLNKSFQISNVMMLNDHINLLPSNPLIGKNEDRFGVRFPDLFEAYSPRLLEKARKIAEEKNMTVREGVYVSVAGPNLETPAEYKFLRIIGADAVGMSTIPEVIVARQMEMEVFAISVITDLCYEGAIEKVTLEKVIAAAQEAEPKMITLMKNLIVDL